jgi:hypothetical protein
VQCELSLPPRMRIVSANEQVACVSAIPTRSETERIDRVQLHIGEQKKP